MSDPISREEHEEFVRRMEDEDSRQNRRLELLEQSVQRMNALTASVEKLATNMEQMVKEQEKQGQRLQTLEARDGDMWRTAIKYVLTALIAGIVGYALKMAGF